MNSAHHVGRERFSRLPIAGAHQRLCRQVEHDLRPRYFDKACELGRIVDVAKMALAKLLYFRQAEKVGLFDRWQADARDLGTESMKPERQPRSFETGMPSEQNALAPPKVGAGLARHVQIFHGALPDSQSSSSRFLSRSVSIGCQKPLMFERHHLSH